jgi:hypothetical protein
MYDVELNFIWIWKNIENCCDNLFEICFFFFFKVIFHNKNMDLWEHPRFICYRCQCRSIYAHVHLFQPNASPYLVNIMFGKD